MNDTIDESLIPEGPYCYTVLDGMRRREDGKISMKTRDCPYLICKIKFGEPVYYCRVIKKATVRFIPWNLIWDGVKECGIKDNVR